MHGGSHEAYGFARESSRVWSEQRLSIASRSVRSQNTPRMQLGIPGRCVHFLTGWFQAQGVALVAAMHDSTHEAPGQRSCAPPINSQRRTLHMPRSLYSMKSSHFFFSKNEYRFSLCSCHYATVMSLCEDIFIYIFRLCGKIFRLDILLGLRSCGYAPALLSVLSSRFLVAHF